MLELETEDPEDFPRESGTVIRLLTFWDWRQSDYFVRETKGYLVMEDLTRAV